MLDEQQFGDWCRRLGVGSKVKNLIRQTRLSEPARHIRSGRGNVSGCYPCRKMGVTTGPEDLKEANRRYETIRPYLTKDMRNRRCCLRTRCKSSRKTELHTRSSMAFILSLN
jgi:hypothetical protein